MMSKKSYESVQYVSQRLEESLRGYLSKTMGGEFPYEFSYSHKTDEGEIRFTIQGLESIITITSAGKGNKYNLNEEIKFGPEENSKLVFNEQIMPGRSSTYRISGNYLENFVKITIDHLRWALKEREFKQ